MKTLSSFWFFVSSFLILCLLVNFSIVYAYTERMQYPCSKSGTREDYGLYGKPRGFGEWANGFNGRHLAIDIGMNTGDKVYAPADGYITYSGLVGGYGGYNYITNKSQSGFMVVLTVELRDEGLVDFNIGHVQGGSYNEGLEVGLIPSSITVSRGQYIATIADYIVTTSSGSVQNWDHLHFGVRRRNNEKFDLDRVQKGYSKYIFDPEGKVIWYEDVDTYFKGSDNFKDANRKKWYLLGGWTDPVTLIKKYYYINSEEAFSIKFESIFESYLNNPYPNSQYYNGTTRNLVGEPNYSRRQQFQTDGQWVIRVPTSNAWDLYLTYQAGSTPDQDRPLAPYPVAVSPELKDDYWSSRDQLGIPLADTILGRSDGNV